MFCPHAVLWDLDGMLVDSEPAHLASIAEVLHDAGCLVPDDLHAWLVGRSVIAVHGLLNDRLGLRMPQEAFVARKTEAYLALISTLTARTGSIDLFRELAAAGVPQAVVSNSDRLIVDANLRAVDLAVAGLVTVSRNDVRCGKPDPEPFLRAAWLLGARPDHCMVVEDSPPGVQAGLDAGMVVLAWPEPVGPVPDFPAGAHIVCDAGELRRALTDSVPISHNMPHVFEVADRIHIHRLGRRACVIRPSDYSMSDAVAIMTGATPVPGEAAAPTGVGSVPNQGTGI